MLKAIASISLLLWAQLAFSQQPSPGGGISVSPPQAQTQNAKEATTGDKRGTEQSPLVIKLMPTKESEQKTAADAKREDEKAANDRRIAKFSELLFYATIALSFIAFLQLLVFGWQGWQIKRSVDAAVESERPRMSLKRLNWERFGNDKGMPIITAAVVNYGRNIARVTESCISLMVTGTLPEKPVYSGRRYIFQGNVIEKGNEFELPKFHWIEWNEFKGDIPGFEFRASIWVYGFIAYLDHLGKEHRYGFVAEWIPPGLLVEVPEGQDFRWTAQTNYAYDT